MERGLRIVRFGLWAVLVLAMAGVVVGKFVLPRFAHKPAAAAAAAPALPVLYPAAEFALTNQEAKPFSSKDLRGRPYVAAFIFTRCGGVCPQMTTAMTRLQQELPASMQFVSVSVDPAHDTPEVL